MGKWMMNKGHLIVVYLFDIMMICLQYELVFGLLREDT